jgi:hypothetical protein
MHHERGEITMLTTQVIRSSAYIRRIVTRPKGSWKYQDAYAISIYRLAKGKKGQWLWKWDSYEVNKASWPQLVRMGKDKIKSGGLHNSVATYDELVEAIGMM